MFADAGDARTVAFVCDASGSMIGSFQSLKAEVGKAVAALRPDQAFCVMFFSNDRYQDFRDGRPVAATAENKRELRRWLVDISTTGTSNPVPALERAFEGGPDLIYVVTDGDFPNNDEVLARVAGLNRGKQTRVNTVAFFPGGEEAELSESFVAVLTRLAEDHGGTLRVADPEAL